MSAKLKMLILPCLVCLIGQVFAYDEVCGVWLAEGAQFVEKIFVVSSNQTAHYEYFGPTVYDCIASYPYFQIIDLTNNTVLVELNYPIATKSHVGSVNLVAGHEYKIKIYDPCTYANRRPWAIVKYSK